LAANESDFALKSVNLDAEIARIFTDGDLPAVFAFQDHLHVLLFYNKGGNTYLTKMITPSAKRCRPDTQECRSIFRRQQ